MKSFDIFILEAEKIHGDKYTYDRKSYVDYSTKFKIFCRIHGEFKQSPTNHIIRKNNCPECAKKSRAISNIKTQDIFISTCLKKFPQYDYSKTIYTSAKNKIKIFCKKHGMFEKEANGFLQGSECPQCTIYNTRKDIIYFIDKSIKTHGYKYDYSKSIYVTDKTKLIIICKKHGEFLQTPNNHIYSKSGCPKCKTSKGENYIRNILEKNNIKSIEQYTFDKCLSVNNNKLKFDFYLPDFNACIEFDGIQHHQPVDYFGGDAAYKKQVVNDLIKDQYCDQNDITMIRINQKNEIYRRINEI